MHGYVVPDPALVSPSALLYGVLPLRAMASCHTRLLSAALLAIATSPTSRGGHGDTSDRGLPICHAALRTWCTTIPCTAYSTSASSCYLLAAATVRYASVSPVTARSRSPLAHVVVILSIWPPGGHSGGLSLTGLPESIPRPNTCNLESSAAVSKACHYAQCSRSSGQPQTRGSSRPSRGLRDLATLPIGIQTQGSKPAPAH